MSALTPLLLRGLAAPGRRLLVPRAQISSKPPREQLGLMDNAIGLVSCFLCFLVPPAWVLCHLEDYKKRD